MMNRRRFLKASLLSVALGLALTACGSKDRNPLEQIDLAKLDAMASALTGFDDEPLSEDADVDDLRMSLAKALVEHGGRGPQLEPALAAAIAADYTAGRVRELDGWMLSRTEADLLAYSAVVHRAKGTVAKFEPSSAETARQEAFTNVTAWGPETSCAGDPFNAQSDGHSSIWISLADDAPSGLLVLVGGRRVSTTQFGGLLTTRIEGDVFDELFTRPGRVPVEIYHAGGGQKQVVGEFDVRAAGDFSVTTTGKPSTVFREVSGWGPTATPVGEPFNQQADGYPALWVAVGCAPARARLLFGDRELESTVTATAISAKLADLSLIERPGSIPVVLFDPETKESVKVGDFVVSN